MPDRGKLIVLEAVGDTELDRLAARLCEWLRRQGLAAERTREPTYGPAGALILQERQKRIRFDAISLALLFLADRLDHLQRENGIESKLARGQHVLCAHFALSAAAHLSGSVEPEWGDRIDRLTHRPDLTLFVDFPVEGPAQRHLRDGFVTCVQRLQAQGHPIVVVARADDPDSAYPACKKEIAHLLGLASASLEIGASA